MATEVASFMEAVQMPTVQHLLNGSLDALRGAIHSASAEEEPTRWVVSHIILGAALRLRGSRMADDVRARMYTEAVRAFDAALAVCCERNGSHDIRGRGIARLGVQPAVCTNGPDGVQLVVDATTVPLPEGNAMLERAIRVFRDACVKANRRTDLRGWFIGMSNLGCTLALLGRRTPGAAGVSILEEAVDVLHDALRVPARQGLAEERASMQINLAEAFQALAERGIPAENLRYIEQAATWLAAALSHYSPPEYRWLLQLERGTLA